LDGSVTDGRNPLTVGTECDRAHGRVWALHRLPDGGAPEPKRPVATAAGDLTAIGTERRNIYRARVSEHRLTDLLAGVGIPQL
jgi:hypothetical protein